MLKNSVKPHKTAIFTACKRIKKNRLQIEHTRLSLRTVLFILIGKNLPTKSCFAVDGKERDYINNNNDYY